MGDDTLDRNDIEATLAVRQELGPAYEPAVVEAFAERVEAAIERQVAMRVEQERRAFHAARARRGHPTTLAVSSLVFGIPITAISGALADLPGVIAAWGGIVGVNVAHAINARRPDGRSPS